MLHAESDWMPTKNHGIQCMACMVLLLPFIGLAEAAPETLEHLISTALMGHPAIQAQQAQERVSKAGVDSAAWQYYPTPSIAIEKASVSAKDTTYRGDNTVSTLRLQQPLWTGGRLTAGMKKAEAGVVASQASIEEVRQQLALRVIQAYGDWLAADLKTQAIDKSLATHVRLREQVKRRIDQGASSDSDFVLAVSRLNSVAADLSVASAQKDIALSRLEQLLGQHIEGAALSASVAAPHPVNHNPQALVDMALALNPTIQKVQAQAKVQESLMAERRADLFPEVYFRAERQFGNFTILNAPPENRLFVGLSSRFGPGLSNISNVEGAKSQIEAVIAEVDAQKRAISEQVLADHALAISSELRIDALGASLEASVQVSESFDRQFLAGRKTWLDVMNAARELAQTEVQMADIQSTRVVVSWRLAIYTLGLTTVLGDGK